MSVIHESYHTRTLPDAIHRNENTLTLLDDVHVVTTNSDHAVKVFDAILSHFPKIHQEKISHTMLCDDMPYELDLLIYIRMGFKSLAFLDDLAHPSIYAVHGYQRRVLSTVHKIHGFLRFEELDDGTLYARIEPKRNVLPLLGSHFKKRLGDASFIIHDTQRSLALSVSHGKQHLLEVAEFEKPTLSAEELKFKRLWKTFFDRIAIETRLNPSLQRQHVPLYYRTFMSEFSDFAEKGPAKECKAIVSKRQ